MSRIQTLSKASSFYGKPQVPGDKSISHRGLILGALAEGTTEIVDLLESEDVQSTARCLKDLGVHLTKSGNKTSIRGLGSSGFTTPTDALDCGNSGTTMRLLMGVLAAREMIVVLRGDASLLRRPMQRVADPLQKMGALFELTNQVYAPLRVQGTHLHGIDYRLKIASAQIKTAILLAALSARGVTTVTGAIHSRDHTERLLKQFGVFVEKTDKAIRIEGGQRLYAAQIHVPGDPSAAAFWLGAASLVPGAQIEMGNIAINPTRIGFIRILQKMGALIEIQVTSENPEPVGQIRIQQGRLRGVTITPEEVPSLIDELPLIAILASQAIGRTEVLGAEELRVKESDRLEAVAQGLRAMGATLEVRRDGFLMEGPQKLRGAQIESYQDHRIAMAFSIAALVAEGQTQIRDADCVKVSYPAFFEILEELTRIGARK